MKEAGRTNVRFVGRGSSSSARNNSAARRSNASTFSSRCSSSFSALAWWSWRSWRKFFNSLPFSFYVPAFPSAFVPKIFENTQRKLSLMLKSDPSWFFPEIINFLPRLFFQKIWRSYWRFEYSFIKIFPNFIGDLIFFLQNLIFKTISWMFDVWKKWF